LKYQAFLSYSHDDRKWAKWLHRRLESYRPPKRLVTKSSRDLPKRLAPVFRDRDELPTVANLSDAVNEALAASAALIVVCSPSAAASRWVNEEIRTFRALERGDRILALIVDGEPNASDSSNCFPPALTENGFEPVAADARSQGDGRTNAFLKVAAGLLEVGFDELKQRDQLRYQRRLASVTVGSFLVAAVTVALAITATIARDEANMRRQQAEDLIGFMLGDLREQLHEIQRLDIFQSVGDKAMDYFSLLEEEDESNHSLFQRAMAMHHIGEVRQDQGNLTAAHEAFTESVRIMETVVQRDPTNADAQLELANSYFFVGYVYWEQGDLGAAREQFERVLPIVTGLRDGDPTNTTWLLETGYAYTNLGRVLELEGALGEALAAYEQVMLTNEKLIDLEPEEPDWQLELGFAHNNLGKLITSLGRLHEAREHYSADLGIKTRLLQANPDHELWQSYEADSQYFLGWLLANIGDVEEGVRLLESAQGTYLRLTTLSPDHALFLDRRARVERRLAAALQLHGDLGRALSFSGSSRGLSSALLDQDGSNSRWRRGLLEAIFVAAEISQSVSDDAGVARAAGDAASHVQLLLEQEPDNLETQQLAVRHSLLMARHQSVAFAEDALTRLDQYFADSMDPWVLDLRVEAMDMLDMAADADNLREQLRDMGFRPGS